MHFPIVVAGALLAQLITMWVEQPAQKYGTRAGVSVSWRMPRPARPTRV
ncbi:hypothetical protein [Cryobacterium sp. Hz9]|nr:hypothetical protein [Cryobacterium sp. Hz9]